MVNHFIPARSSRHRKACLSLYKSLVGLARRVPLPDHVNTCAPDAAYVNPLQRFIRRSFRQNKWDSSPRLITAALNAGYNMMNFLAEARVPDSKEHSTVVAFLEKHKPPVHYTYRQWVEKKKRERERRLEEAAARGEAPRLPLLTQRTIPGSARTLKDALGNVVTACEFEYVPSYDSKPLSELPGRRRVPRLVTEASGIPFLRLRRTQPRVLSHIIRHRRERRAKRTSLVSELFREGLDFATQEDLWEENLARAIAESGQKPLRESVDYRRARGADNNPVTYRQSVALSIAYVGAQLNLDAVDMLARSKAYMAIVDRERELARKEDLERLEQLRQQGNPEDSPSKPKPVQ